MTPPPPAPAVVAIRRRMSMRVKVALSVFLVVQQTHAFVVVQLPAGAGQATTCILSSGNSDASLSSLTELYGLRSFLRRKFFSKRQQEKVLIRKDAELGLSNLLEESFVTVPKTIVPTQNGSVPRTAQELLQHDQSTTAIASSTTTTTAKLGQKDMDTLCHYWDAPYTLPHRDESQLSTFEREFRNMLLDFSQFTRRDIAHVTSPRLRALFQGIVASYNIPETYRAFEILFQDYAPLRIGGRLIYAQLKQAMLEAQQQRQQEVESICQETGLSKEEIEESRIAWLKMAVHHKDDTEAQSLSIQQLIDLGLAETVAEILGQDDFDEWLYSTFWSNFTTSTTTTETATLPAVTTTKTDERVTFCEMMIALQNCSVDSLRPECNMNTLLPEIAKRLDQQQQQLQLVGTADSLDGRPPPMDKKQLYMKRYDNMVQSFLEWKNNVADHQNSLTRKMEVLNGCFAGAESDEIVNALRIVYTDYSALRFAGDLIFKVMKTLVGTPPKEKKTVTLNSSRH